MDDKEKASARLSAFNMLARREHSRQELTQKLARRFDDTAGIQQLLDELRSEGLQSDQRFLESFVHERVQRGHGPVKIAYELRNRGIGDDMIIAELESHQESWLETARELVKRKYGEAGPEDLKEKQRRMRFVMQRGFPADVCYRLFD